MPAARFKSASRVVAEVAARRWPPGGVEIFTLGGFDARSAQCTATTVIPTGAIAIYPAGLPAPRWQRWHHRAQWGSLRTRACDRLRVGSIYFAICSSLLSGLNRHEIHPSSGLIEDIIHTNATVNSGNSRVALDSADVNGIGMNAMGNNNFSVSTAIINHPVSGIAGFGSIARAALGLSLWNILLVVKPRAILFCPVEIRMTC